MRRAALIVILLTTIWVTVQSALGTSYELRGRAKQLVSDPEAASQGELAAVGSERTVTALPDASPVQTWYLRLVSACGPKSESTRLHEMFADLLFGLRDHPELLQDARTLLISELQNSDASPDPVALLAFSLVAVAGDQVALDLWDRLVDAPRSVWVHATIAARFDVGAEGEKTDRRDEIAAGVMLSRLLQPNFAGWQDRYFTSRFGVEGAGGLNTIHSPHAQHDLELRRQAFARFREDVSPDFLRAVTASAIDESIPEADRRAVLYYTHMLDRSNPVVASATMTVAERAVSPNVRIAALAVLNAHGATEQIRERLRAMAREESDAAVLERVVQAMRHTNTGAGSLFVDLFSRFDNPKLRQEVALLAISKSASVDAPEVETVLRHVLSNADVALLGQVAPRLGRRGYLKAPSSLLLAAFRAALLAAGTADYEELMKVVDEYAESSLDAILREIEGGRRR